MKNSNNETQIGVPGPGVLSYEECSVTGGKISFECPKCKETHRLQTTLFSSQSAKPAEGLMPISDVIFHGRTIWGHVVALVIAVVVASIIGIVAIGVGRYGFWGVGVAVLIYLGLRKVFIPKYMRKLPIWAFECKNCGNRIFIASDATKVLIGKIQAKVGE